ncbi:MULTISPECIES: hypothetical protein [unclassified Streptomyces]|uniref:hypothetical protein n=1 Tax=unclassified Streptomyces TaxID=2593676 RepID=UPI0016621187|nr:MULTISPECIES: hypothetical protein [unclassified Streptomyces]MBD0838936.1 hypothetical protein [Streptomyces sp. TRM68416]
MSSTQQYLLDALRARQHGEAPPAAPGTHDGRLVHAFRDDRRFRAVVAGRPARGRTRQALARWLQARPRPTR